MTGSQREAVNILMMMESVTVNADLIAQALSMNPGVRECFGLTLVTFFRSLSMVIFLFPSIRTSLRSLLLLP